MCLKKEKFCLKSGEDKKNVFFAITFEVIRKSTKSVFHSIAIHFAKMIRNYPKSDFHFAMRHRLFSALFIDIY